MSTLLCVRVTVPLIRYLSHSVYTIFKASSEPPKDHFLKERRDSDCQAVWCAPDPIKPRICIGQVTVSPHDPVRSFGLIGSCHLSCSRIRYPQVSLRCSNCMARSKPLKRQNSSIHVGVQSQTDQTLYLRMARCASEETRLCELKPGQIQLAALSSLKRVGRVM